MNSSDPMMKFRLHWCDVIEEALECPVCFEVPTDINIYICTNGHDVCNTCKKVLESCPVCKAKFTGTRNRNLEQIAQKFDNIKESLLDPNICRKPKLNKIKPILISISTQTDDELSSEINSADHKAYKNIGTQTPSNDEFSSGAKSPRRTLRGFKHNN